MPLFAGEKELRKLIMKIKTNSLEPGQPKDPNDSALYEIYRAFATDDEAAAIRKRYAEGIAWGEMKQLLFERINAEIAPARAEYERLMANPREVEDSCGRCREGAGRESAVPRRDSRQGRHPTPRALTPQASGGRRKPTFVACSNA